MNSPTVLFGQSIPTVVKPKKRLIFVLQSKSRPRRWHTYVPVILVPIVVLISPIPLASNHPVIWLFWSTLIGICALVLSFYGPKKTLFIGKIPGIIVFLGSVFLIFGLYQAVPIPKLFGAIEVAISGQQVALSSLSIAPTFTIIAVIRGTSYLIFFWIVLLHAKNTRHAQNVAWIIYLGIVLHALFAVAALILFNDTNFIAEKSTYFGKATGTFINKNSFATFLGMGVVLGISLFFHPKNYSGVPSIVHNRYLKILSLGIICIALILTQSRLGIAATVLASISMASPAVKLITGRSRAILTLAALSAIPLAFYVLQNSPGALASAANRFELYKQVLGMVADRPLSGFGQDSFALAFEIYHAPPLTSDLVWQNAHSSYLTLWVENGLIFGSLPMLIGVLAVYSLQRKAAHSALALAGFGALVLAGLHSLFDFSLEIQANTFLFITLIGLGLGQVHNQRITNDGSRR